MHRQKGILNTPQSIIDEIVMKHRKGATLKSLSAEYGKPFKTIKNMFTRENNKERRQTEGLEPKKSRGRKPKFAELVAECQHLCGNTYGYRRVQIWLKSQKIFAFKSQDSASHYQ